MCRRLLFTEPFDPGAAVVEHAVHAEVESSGVQTQALALEQLQKALAWVSHVVAPCRVLKGLCTVTPLKL